MKRMQPPTFGAMDVYEACAGGMDPSARGKYPAGAGDFLAQAEMYDERAYSHILHLFPASTHGNDAQVVLGHLTKGDLRRLYEKGMVGSHQGRTFYDKLLAAAPLGKCPYCWLGHAETLDHFLPKARYPSFSVLPSNLVPACMRCNNGKGSGVITQQSEMSHPYFEDPRIEQAVWLYAKITESNPATASYAIVPPEEWPADLSRRVANYFQEFDLSKRYAVEAASEMVSVSAYLCSLPESHLRVEHLNRVGELERNLSSNGWKAALYTALSGSIWYSEVGYANTGSLN